MTLDKTNVLLIHFRVFCKNEAIFCLSVFSQISGKDMEYLSNSKTVLTLHKDAASYSTEMRAIHFKHLPFNPKPASTHHPPPTSQMCPRHTGKPSAEQNEHSAAGPLTALQCWHNETLIRAHARSRCWGREPLLFGAAS